MSNRVKFALTMAILFWASAFVGIRAALMDYQPGCIALLRCIIATAMMTVVYFRLPSRKIQSIQDGIVMILAGTIGLGFYHLALNHGEMSIKSGMASFIISMAPVFTALFAIIFLGERINKMHVTGMLVSIAGISLISFGERHGFNWDSGLGYIFLATIAGSLYTVLQKSIVHKYHVIEVTTYAMWGGTLFLLFYLPNLLHDISHASITSTAIVVYLGIFPTAIGYLAWSFVLTEISASRSVTFLYFTPFVTTLLGWAFLKETPALLSITGGSLAIFGVWLVNRAYKARQFELASEAL